jgi:hypothetical protein
VKLTNRLNLPDTLVNAVKNDNYSKGDADYSVTTLLKPPRIVALEKLHKEELEEDVSDRIWALLGQIMHGVLERAGGKGLLEQRFTADFGGVKVSGAIDLYVDGLVQDYKLLSVYKVKDGKAPLEYEQQLNIYAYLLKKHNLPVHTLELVCVLRDWSKMEAKRNPNYPQNQVVKVPVRLWPEVEQLNFIDWRITLHQDAVDTLPECTPMERWEDEPKWAVMKKGQKKAVKLIADQEAAEALAGALGSNHYVQYRRPIPKRCESYCSVSKFCTQYQNLIKGRQDEE